MSKKILLVTCGLFYLSMILLTVCAKRTHTATLARVLIGYPEQMSFAEGETHTYLPAVPQELGENKLFYLVEEQKNGEMRFFVREAGDIILGEAEDGYCPVLGGFSAGWPLIMEHTEELTDGQEVFVENEEEYQAWN